MSRTKLAPSYAMATTEVRARGEENHTQHISSEEGEDKVKTSYLKQATTKKEK